VSTFSATALARRPSAHDFSTTRDRVATQPGRPAPLAARQEEKRSVRWARARLLRARTNRRGLDSPAADTQQKHSGERDIPQSSASTCTHGLRKGATIRLTAPAYRKFESIPLQQTVRRSPDFASVRDKAPVSRQVGDCTGRQGRQRRAKRRKIAPRSGSVSVEPYFSTAVRCWMRFVRLARRAARDVGSP
jgi:hypothetical protein